MIKALYTQLNLYVINIYKVLIMFSHIVSFKYYNDVFFKLSVELSKDDEELQAALKVIKAAEIEVKLSQLQFFLFINPKTF